MPNCRSMITMPLLCAITCSMMAGDWPQYRGQQRSGIAQESGLLQTWPAEGPRLLWTSSALGVGYAGPAVVGERLYVSGVRDGSEVLLAFDLKAQSAGAPKELWSAKIGPVFTWKGNNWNEGPNVSPTVSGDCVLALGGFGDLICVDAATGTQRWRVNLPRDFAGEVNPIGGGLEEPTPLGWGYAGAPLVDGNKVIVVAGGRNGLLAALDKNTGKRIWQSKEAGDQASYSSPILTEIGGVPQYIQVTNAGIVGIAAADGKLLWRYQRSMPYDDVVIATPIVHDGYILSTVGFGQGCDLIKVDLNGSNYQVQKILSDKSLQNRDGGVVLVGTHVFGHSENRGWVCKEFTTGKELWMERSKLARGSVTFADNRLYCCSEEGVVTLAEASPQGWKEHGRFKLPQASEKRKPSGGMWTHPVIANGKLYLRDQELLFCYDLVQPAK